MVATAEAAANSAVTKLGFAPGQVVQEIGYDSDVDDDLRIAIEDVIGSELEDEDYGNVADAVTLWWREDDGDLTDALVDALTNLADRGLHPCCCRRRSAGWARWSPARSRRPR